MSIFRRYVRMYSRSAGLLVLCHENVSGES